MPAYQREAAPKQRSRRSLVVGIVAGVTGLALGFGAGYLIGAASAPTREPVVITRTLDPPALDANGMPLGKRVPPFDTMTPTALPAQVALDANGMPFGPRVPQDL
jgi:ABC-type antimicrobial peptide transport system permease subunit